MAVRRTSYLIVLLFAFSLGAPAAAAADDWWGFQRDARHTGAADGPDLAAELGIVFSIELNEPVKASPLVADERVFVVTEPGHVYAFDWKTGAKVWGPIQVPHGVTGTPAYESERLFVATSSADGAAGSIVVLDARDGRQVTSIDLGRGSYGGPTLLGGTLYVGTEGAEVHAFETATLTRLWRFGTGVAVSQPAGGNASNECCLTSAVEPRQVRVAPAVHGEMVYFGAFNQMLFAVDATGTPGTATTQLRWVENVHGIQFSAPAVSEKLDRVFVGSYDGLLYSFDAQPLQGGNEHCLKPSRPQHPYPQPCSANVVWRYDTDSRVFSSPALANEKVYVGDNDGRVHAVWQRYGSAAWVFDAGAGVYSSPAVVGRTLAVGSYTGELIVLRESLQGGLDSVARIDVGGRVHASPAIADGFVYVVDLEGRLIGVGDAALAPQDPNVPIGGGQAPTQAPSAGPDVLVERLVVRPERPDAGNETEVEVVVANRGSAAVETTVHLYGGEAVLGEVLVAVEAGASASARFPIVFERGLVMLRAVVDEGEALEDSDRANNVRERPLSVGAAFTAQGSEGRESPGPAGLVLLGVALLAAARRRS